MFHNRTQAGIQLAKIVREKVGPDNTRVLVLGIPRGGVVVAAEVARVLNAPLDIVITKKIGAPTNPEYAIGAINLDGEAVWNASEVARFGLTPATQQKLVSETLKQAQEKERRLRNGRSAPDLRGKTVIVVDDGIATGYTALAALRYVLARAPARVELAVPVAALDAVQQLAREADAVLSCETPEYFAAVGAFYEDFPQVEDEQVRALLGSS